MQGDKRQAYTGGMLEKAVQTKIYLEMWLFDLGLSEALHLLEGKVAQNLHLTVVLSNGVKYYHLLMSDACVSTTFRSERRFYPQRHVTADREVANHNNSSHSKRGA